MKVVSLRTDGRWQTASGLGSEWPGNQQRRAAQWHGPAPSCPLHGTTLPETKSGAHSSVAITQNFLLILL